MLLQYPVVLMLVLVRSGWIMSFVVELRPASLPVDPIHSEVTIVNMQMMLEYPALALAVLKEPSDCKEALPLLDVWKSAITTSGVQCAMTSSAL